MWAEAVGTDRPYVNGALRAADAGASARVWTPSEPLIILFGVTLEQVGPYPPCEGVQKEEHKRLGFYLAQA